jgi:hypothetical protein
MDDDCDWADVTGDPQLDQFGYQSPRRRGENLTGFTPSSDRDWRAQAKRDRAQRAARRKANALSPQRRQPEPPPAPVKVRAWPSQPVSQGPQPVSQGPQPVGQGPQPVSQGPLPGQHGAYFEVRTTRVWWAPWRKKRVWQQISAWQMGVPPTSGVEVVTVPSVDAVPGRVHTIGTVGPNGTVVY